MQIFYSHWLACVQPPLPQAIIFLFLHSSDGNLTIIRSRGEGGDGGGGTCNERAGCLSFDSSHLTLSRPHSLSVKTEILN